MIELIEWVIERLFTKAFWYYVLSSFAGVIIFSIRGNYRNEIFKAAVDSSKKGQI